MHKGAASFIKIEFFWSSKHIEAMAIKGKLEILLVEAKDLEDIQECDLGWSNCVCPWNRVMKPYALVRYAEQECSSRVAQGKGSKRQWNQKFTFDAEYDPMSGEDHNVHKVIIRIMDKHKLSDDEFVGETTVYVKDVLSIGAEKGKLQVEAHSYRVVQSDKTFSGEISIAIAFTKVQNQTEEVPGNCNDSSN